MPNDTITPFILAVPQADLEDLIVLAGEPLGLETARDLFREVRHCYPELVDEFV